MIKKKSKVSKESLEMAWSLIGLKIYNDYKSCLINNLIVEPEHFYEVWMERNVVRPSKKCKLFSWRVFMNGLISNMKKVK